MSLPFEQLPRESDKAFAAFRCYLELGPQRSVELACKKLGKSAGTLDRWTKKFDWRGRVAAQAAYFSELERSALESLACTKAVDWWQLHEAARRQAWREAEKAIALVAEARKRWEKSGRTVGFEGMARMLDLAFKLKQFAAGMPSEIKETHTLVSGKVSVEWEEAIRKAYGQVAPAGDQARPPATDSTVVDVQEVKP